MERENYVSAMQNELQNIVQQRTASTHSSSHHQHTYSSKNVVATAQSHSTRDQSNSSAHISHIYPPKVISGPANMGKNSNKVDMSQI